MKKLLLILICFYSGLLLSQNALSKRDSNFVRIAADKNLLQVKLAQLAQTNTSSGDVKNLSAELLSYHTKALGELKTLAGKKNIPLNTQLSNRSQKYYDKHAKKQGGDFDKAYTMCMTRMHHRGHCFLKKESKKGRDPEIRSWALANYPVLEQYEEKSKQTCKDLKKNKK